MNHKKHMERLEELYKIAIEIKDIASGLTILEIMIKSCAVEAESNLKA